MLVKLFIAVAPAVKGTDQVKGTGKGSCHDNGIHPDILAGFTLKLEDGIGALLEAKGKHYFGVKARKTRGVPEPQNGRAYFG